MPPVFLFGYKQITRKFDMELLAKPILKDKFWIVEKDNQKVGTIRANGVGVVITLGKESKTFESKQQLISQLNVSFEDNTKSTSVVKKEEHTVHDYPAKHKPYNPIYDLKRKLPLYTKTPHSKSFYCAGYYIVKFDFGWVQGFSPKLITLTRNKFKGPFTTKLEVQEHLRKANHAETKLQ